MSITNPDQTGLETAAKYANPSNIVGEVGNLAAGAVGSVVGGVAGTIRGVTSLAVGAVNLIKNPIAGVTNFVGGILGGRNPISSEPMTYIQQGSVSFGGARDLRVRLQVPMSYLVQQAAGPSGELGKAKGIIFPYTTQLVQEHKATYSPVNVTHSNYTQYFYKNSSVGELTLTSKFTVQNEQEAAIYLATVHLLRALTKMKFGDDDNSGAPPPVCRLYGYGEYMFDKVPVVVSSVRIDTPADVDYFTTNSDKSRNPNTGIYGNNAVPVISTIIVGLLPVYSRDEMRSATVDGWLTGEQRRQGFL